VKNHKNHFFSKTFRGRITGVLPLKKENDRHHNNPCY
jgi:hypothetical protein